MLKQMIVRVEDNLHRKIKSMAALEGKSLTTLVNELLEKYVEEKDNYEEKENAKSPGTV